MARKILAALDLRGPLQSAGSAGTTGQALISGGASSTPTWGMPTYPSTAQQLFLAAPASGSGTPTFRYITTSDFTQSSSPSIGQALVAAPVTGGWSWSTVITSNGGSLTGTLSITGTLAQTGTASPITLNGSAGTAGQILTSAGAGATPTWATPGTTPVIKVAANRTTTAGGTALTINTQETATTVTFPTSRFTVAPSVVAATSSPRYVAAVTSVASTGFTMIVRNVSDGTGTTYTWHYQAIEIVTGMGS